MPNEDLATRIQQFTSEMVPTSACKILKKCSVYDLFYHLATKHHQYYYLWIYESIREIWNNQMRSMYSDSEYELNSTSFEKFLALTPIDFFLEHYPNIIYWIFILPYISEEKEGFFYE